MNNALVIDLEHWYSNEFLTEYLPAERVDQVLESVKPILDLLDKYNVNATFAVLGTVAEKHPELIQDIYERGHEIASHAYSHKTLYDLGKDDFEREIKTSVNLLKSITGEHPIGFRAPSFSLDNSTRWAIDILEKYGFKYDASVFPIKTMLYGVPDAPLVIYKPSKDDITKHDPNGKVFEFPMTVLKIGTNIPIAGGFYLRLLPLWFLKFGIRKVNKTRSAILYIHPWETYSDSPRVNAPFTSRFIAYHGLNSAFKKFEVLIKEFSFKPIREVIPDI